MKKLEVIKAKMDAIVNRWKGQDVTPGSYENTLRTIARMHYRELKRSYDIELNLNGSLLESGNVVQMAEEIFGAKAN